MSVASVSRDTRISGVELTLFGKHLIGNNWFYSTLCVKHILCANYYTILHFRKSVEWGAEMYFGVVKKCLLPVVLCECETWFLTLTTEHVLGIFEDRLHRNVFGPNRKEVRWKQRKKHTGEFHDLPSYIILSG